MSTRSAELNNNTPRATGQCPVSSAELRASMKQHKERSVPERCAEFLLAGRVAHAGFVQDGQPFVIPFTYHFEADAAGLGTMYLHGGLESRAMAQMANGQPLCVTVTELDALIASKTALNHSMNYRSVVCFGKGRLVTEQSEKARVLAAMIDRYFPQRAAGRDYEAATPQHLDITEVVAVDLDAWSGKTRSGGPTGPHDRNAEHPGTSGIIPVG